MKKLPMIITLISLNSSLLFSQVSITNDGTAPDNSAMLDVKSTTRGVAIPRMTFSQREDILDPVEGLIVFCSNGSLDGNGTLSIYLDGKWRNFLLECPAPGAPVAGMHVPGETQITWNWDVVPIALGYRWNTVDDYNTATDLGAATTTTETGLACATTFTRYIWAYNDCGISSSVSLTRTTLMCSSFTCGSSFTIDHLEGDVAPVTKTVTYSTVTNIPGEPARCWISHNLGADHQATNVDDGTEASAGWYWQFNRKQGYKHDGTTRTPNTAWNSVIQENTDWTAAEDPCALELTNSWHVPTYTQWNNVDAIGGWVDWVGPWNSDLKLHGAGYLRWDNGSLMDRGTTFFVFYASNKQSEYYDHSYAWILGFDNWECLMVEQKKSWAFPIRCVKDTSCTVEPDAPEPGIHAPDLEEIEWNWNPVTYALGYKWNIINDYNTATDIGNETTMYETGLECGTSYTRYVWAYNDCGNSAPVTLTESTLDCWECGNPILVEHSTWNGVAPVDKSVEYGTVTSIPGESAKCWIISNLGASHQAEIVGDVTEASAGWYWQFNRKQGYMHDGTTRTPNTTWITGISENSDWSAVQDPCTIEIGEDWRIPTFTEWNNVMTAGNWTNWNGPWNSDLKLHAAGHLLATDGSLYGRGSRGFYWSSSQDGNSFGWSLYFYNNSCTMYSHGKAYAKSIRCLREQNLQR